MGPVLPLSHTAMLAYTQYLLNILGTENEAEVTSSLPTCHEMEKVLGHLLKYYTHMVTSEMICQLAPPHLRELCLDSLFKQHSSSTRAMKTEHVVNILRKCQYLDHLSLMECTDLNLEQLFHLAGPCLSHLVSLNLDSCSSNVQDNHVQMLLTQARKLRHLSLADTHVTDRAFLLDEHSQLRHETFSQTWKTVTQQPDHKSWVSPCSLVSVDVSGCLNFSSTGVRHICSLTGHTLHKINISCTQADFTALLYLSGFSLPDMVLFSLGVEVDQGDASHLQLDQLQQELDRCQTICQSLLKQHSLPADLCVEDDVYGCTQYEKEESKDSQQSKALQSDGKEPAANCSNGHGADPKDVTAAVSDAVSCTQAGVEIKEPTDRKQDTISAAGECVHVEDAQLDVSHDLQHSEDTACCEPTHVAHDCEVTTSTSTYYPPICEEKTREKNTACCMDDGNTSPVASTALSFSVHQPSKMSSQTVSCDTIYCDGPYSLVSSDSLGKGLSSCLSVPASTVSGGVSEVKIHKSLGRSSSTEQGCSVHETIGETNHNFQCVDANISSVSAHAASHFEPESSILLGISDVESTAANLTDLSVLVTESDSDHHTSNNAVTDLSCAVCASIAQSVKFVDNYSKGECLEETREELKTDVRSAICENFVQKTAPQLLFTPKITSVCLSSDCLGGIDNSQLGLACLDKFLSANPQLLSLAIVCSPQMPLVDQALDVIGKRAPGLKHLSLDSAETITDSGLSQLLNSCTSLSRIGLSGAPFISDAGLLPLWKNSQVEELMLSESSVATPTLLMIAAGIGEQLHVLDLAWCENVEEASINRALSACGRLTSLNLRQCPVSDHTLAVISGHCIQLTFLSLSCVKEITDAAVTSLVSSLGQLQSVDLSWNLDLTDVSVGALLVACPWLHTAELSGLKRITSTPFLPIIADVECWQRQKILVSDRFRSQAGQNTKGLTGCQPRRSTSYAACLQHLHLHYCDRVQDAHMEEVAFACQGALTIINYYGEPATPRIHWTSTSDR